MKSQKLLYIPIFAQLLEVKIIDNFITINNQKYNILHNFQSAANPNQNQGRIGLDLVVGS